MQINNLTLRWSRIYQKWQVLAPDKRVLGEFESDKSAMIWMEDTTDFVEENMGNGIVKVHEFAL